MLRFQSLLITLSVFLSGGVSWGGVTGENVIVVVNAKSIDSMTIANHYGQLRSIPDSHFIYLDDVPEGLKCDFKTFKEKILLPVFSEIQKRKLSLQAKVIVYSTGFPTTVDTKEYTARLSDPTVKKIQGYDGSLTGLTYLYQLVLADNESFLSLHANLYARGTFERHFVNPYPAEDPNVWLEAEALDSEEKYAEAGKRWLAFLKQHPTQGPAGIRAAQSFAKVNQDSQAIKSLQLAIQAGWRSKRFLTEDETLKELLSRSANNATTGYARLQELINQLDDLPEVTQHPVAFSADRSWPANGWPSLDPKEGMRYMPSCMLGVIHPLASTSDQIMKGLTRSVTGDHSFPKAPFQFTLTNDIRSKTRKLRAAEAVLLLSTLGKEASLISRPVPIENTQLAGLMLGIHVIRPEHQKWSLVPGSISENLTSLACNFRSRAQTKSTLLLHLGASLTCGPVDEPYAIAQKFPDPMLYAHYARGATAIEAIYLSLWSPYQTLVIGDPLACAYTTIPSDSIAITASSAGTSANIQLQPNLVTSGKTQTARLEVFLEGRLVQKLSGHQTLRQRIRMDGGGKLHGYVEVRVTAVGSTPLETRRMKAVEIDFGNMGSQIQINVDEQKVRASCQQATKIQIISRRRNVASSDGDHCEVEIDPEKFGRGPVRMRALATIHGKRVASKSFTVIVPNP